MDAREEAEMKKIALMLLTLGVVVGGLAIAAEARGPGWGRGNGCPAWSNASWKGYGPANCPAYNGKAQGYGRGYGPGWMRGYGPAAPGMPPGNPGQAPGQTGG